MFYIIDLERTMNNGFNCYWKPRKMGYTYDIKEAGIYSTEEAVKIANNDIKNDTVLLPVKDYMIK